MERDGVCRDASLESWLCGAVLQLFGGDSLWDALAPGWEEAVAEALAAGRFWPVPGSQQ